MSAMQHIVRIAGPRASYASFGFAGPRASYASFGFAGPRASYAALVGR